MRIKKLLLLFALALLSQSSVFAKTTLESKIGVLGRWEGVYLSIDACVLVGTPKVTKQDADNYTIVFYCSDYDDLVAYNNGSMARVPVYPFSPYERFSRGKMKEFTTSAMWKAESVHNVVIAFENRWYNTATGKHDVWCDDAKCVFDKLIYNPPGDYRGIASRFKYLTTLIKFANDEW